jgi:hypothetical protein
MSSIFDWLLGASDPDADDRSYEEQVDAQLEAQEAERKAKEQDPERIKQIAMASRILMKMRETSTTGDKARDAARLAAGKVALKVLPDEIVQAATSRVDQQYKELGFEDGEAPKRIGRRAHLRAQEDFDKDTAFIKCTIAGSGYDMWLSAQDKAKIDALVKKASRDGTLSPDEWASWNPAGWERIDGTSVLCWERRRGNGDDELMFAGPGGKGTTGWHRMLEKYVSDGVLDRGSNSIAALVGEAPKQIDTIVQQYLKGNPAKPIVILIKAHSRGSVAADQVAAIVKEKYAGKNVKVEVSLADPVPGPGNPEDMAPELDEFQQNPAREIDMSAMDESTVVYSVSSGYGYGFTPQRVLGAKRIIISKQNHSAGLAEGFVYKGVRYKGLSLNNLAEGIYIDANDNGESKLPLKRIFDIAQLQKDVGEAAEYELGEDVFGNSLDADVVGEHRDKTLQDMKDLEKSSKDRKGYFEGRVAALTTVLNDYYERHAP